MTSVAKFTLPLLLLAACGQDPIAPPPSVPEEVTQARPQPSPVAPEQAPAEAERTEVERQSVTDYGDSHSDASQGVKGRILLPNGEQAAGVQVLLMENIMSNPIDVFLKNKAGRMSPPIASAFTAEDGSFALGVRKPGQKVDLRIITEAHPELSKSPISVRSDDWIDVGDLKLEVGLTVQGRVVNAATNAPVADATVWLTSTTRAHMMTATPGRERGVAAVTDGAGFFRFTSAPTLGTINMTAEAEGYASATVLNKQISKDAVNDFTLKIEAGSTIRGVIVTPEGERVPNAKVQAFGLSVKTPQNATATADANGEFAFPPLRRGPYRLTTTAYSYADNEVSVALTGEDVKIVLEPRATVHLKVLNRQNRPIKSYRISLKRAFPQNPDAIGNVMEFPDRNISPRDYRGDWAVINNMPAGDFRFQVMEKSHAKSLSPMFQVLPGSTEPVEVVVILTDGATITGTVVDDSGLPVAGATVTSDLNQGLAAGTGLFDILRSMIPQKHTTRQVRTDEQGRFRITKLSFADYMVRASHPKFCEGTSVDIKLTQEGQVVDAGQIQLRLGARVVGVTTVGGVPMGQIKVTIGMPTPETNKTGSVQPRSKPFDQMTSDEQQQAARMLFTTNTLSDGNGNFSMLKRVPPGTYKITAARQSAENPFEALMDMRETERQFTVAPGQDVIEINFDLSSR